MISQLLLIFIIMLLLRIEHHLAFLVSRPQPVPATAASASAASLPPSPVLIAVEPLEAPVPTLPVEVPEPPVDDESLEDTPTDPVDTFQMTIQYHLRTPDQAVQYLLDRSKLRFTTRRVGGEEHAPLWQGRIRATMPDGITVVDINTPVMAGSKQCRAWAATTITSAF